MIAKSVFLLLTSWKMFPNLITNAHLGVFNSNTYTYQDQKMTSVNQISTNTSTSTVQSISAVLFMFSNLISH